MISTWGNTAYFAAGAVVLALAFLIGPLTKNEQGRRFAARCFILPAMVAAFLAAGYFAGSWRAGHFDGRMRQALRIQGSSIAGAINPELVRMLEWRDEDRLNPAFTRLGDQLSAYARATGKRSIYTMALRDGKIIFGPESLSPSDPLASPPGTPYEEPPPELLDVFAGGGGVTIGPYSDEYGTFVSSFYPVTDPLNGSVLAVAGLDVEARDWKMGVGRARFSPYLAALLFALVFAAWGRFAKKRSASGCPQVTWREGVFLVFFAGAFITTAIAIAVKDREDEARLGNFTQLSAVNAESVGDAMREIRRRNMALMATALELNPAMTGGDFARLVGPLVGDAAVLAYEWIPRQAEASEHIFSSLAEPGSAAEKLKSFDHLSDPERMKAMEEAVRTSLPTVAGPVRLPEAGDEEGLVFFSPVFGDSGEEGHAGRRWVAGFVAAAVSPSRLLGGVLARRTVAGVAESALGACLFSLSKTGGAYPVATCPEGWADSSSFPLQGDAGFPSAVFPIFAFGKAFAVVMRPGPAYVSTFSMRIWWVVLAAGFLLTSTVALTVGVLGRRKRLLEEEVSLRTAELSLTRERFAQMAEFTREVIWETDAEGLFTYVSHACLPLLGYAPEGVVGRMHFYDLHPEEGREDFKRRAFEIFRRRGIFRDLHNVIVGRDGRRVDVLTNGAPVISAGGELLGYRGSDRDVTERMAADAALKKKMEESSALTRLMVGREQRVIELKEEVNALLRELGREAKYGA